MPLNSDHLPVPSRLITPAWFLHRQRPEDNDADYLAVMASRERLRLWSDSSWPEDGFSRAANLADLQMHIAEHDQNLAYGFSVYTPDGSALLGSVYVSEVAPFLNHYTVSPEQRQVLENGQARVDYWLRTSVTPDFEQRFLVELRQWFVEQWWFRRIYFGSRRNDQRQRRVYEAGGLQQVAALVALDGSRTFHFHG